MNGEGPGQSAAIRATDGPGPRALRVAGGQVLDIELPWPAASLRLVRRVEARDGSGPPREDVLARWGPADERRRRLEMPRTAATWTGEAIAITHALIARSPAGETVEWPVTVLPATPPRTGVDQPTAEQAAAARYGVQRRAARNLIAALAETVLTLVSLATVLRGALALWTGSSPGPAGWPGVILGLGWLCAIVVIVARRVRSRRRLGALDTSAVPLGGEVRGSSGEGCLASLVLVEHFAVLDRSSGQRGTARMIRTLDRRYVGAGRWALPIPEEGPASCGVADGGVSWWVQLETPDRQTRLPFTVLPWAAPSNETGPATS